MFPLATSSFFNGVLWLFIRKMLNQKEKMMSQENQRARCLRNLETRSSLRGSSKTVLSFF